MRRLVVDRLEGAWAICEPTEGGGPVELPASWLPEGAAEGSVLCCALSLAPDDDPPETAERLRRLSADDDGGDFSI